MNISKKQLKQIIGQEFESFLKEGWMDKFYISKKRAAELDSERELDLPPARKFSSYSDSDEDESSEESDYDSLEDSTEDASIGTSPISDLKSHWVSFADEVNNMYSGPHGGALDGKIKNQRNASKFKTKEDKKRARAQKEIIHRLNMLEKNLRRGTWRTDSTFRAGAIKIATGFFIDAIIDNLDFLKNSYDHNTPTSVIEKHVKGLIDAIENREIKIEVNDDDTEVRLTEASKMKITKQKLVKIISEEVKNLLSEGDVVDLFPMKGNRRLSPDEYDAATKKQGLVAIPDELDDKVWDMMEELVNEIMELLNNNKYDHRETLVGMFSDSLDNFDAPLTDDDYDEE